jgi:hypothetical protein
MEERILIRCRRTMWWRWPALAFAACCLTVFVWVRPVEHGGGHIVKPNVAGETARATVAPLPLERRVRRRRRPDVARALWRFAQQHPEATGALTAEYETAPVVPLTIEPIAIEELGDSK